MKKMLALWLFVASSLMTYAQKVDTAKNSIQKNAETLGHGGNNELKINLLSSVIGMPEISYERVLVDNMAVGASIAIVLDEIMTYDFSFVPYYRLYFGAKKASGFFIEGNASILKMREYHFYYYSSGSYSDEYSAKATTTNFGLGAAAGAKFLTRNGFLGEVYLGVGRVLGNKYYSQEAYPRIGITIGKRF